MALPVNKMRMLVKYLTLEILHSMVIVQSVEARKGDRCPYMRVLRGVRIKKRAAENCQNRCRDSRLALE